MKMASLSGRVRPTTSLGFVGAAVAALALGAPLAVAPSAAVAAERAPSFAGEIADFYRARSGAPLWFAAGSRGAPQQLLQLLATAQTDGLNPQRYNTRAVSRAIADASRGNPVSIQRAEMVLSSAFVAYARDLRHDPRVGIVYVDQELAPAPQSARTLLSQAAQAASLGDYIQKMDWMNPIYGRLRAAVASRMYRSEAERRLLAINLERARALPPAIGRYVIVNAPAARLYMYENGQVVDSMRVVAGRADPIAQTPMMNAFIRYVALNPYWNSPPDITARRLAPKVVAGGRAYLNEKGYEILSDWSENARVIDPMTIDWKAVAAGRLEVRMRQKPGPANSMGRMKIMFPNKQGIWLHDTPEREKIEEAARLQSNGCVRLEDAPRFARWLVGRPLKAQGARPEQKVLLPTPVPIYLTYLTAVPSGSSIVYFDDFYGKDRLAPRRASGA